VLARATVFASRANIDRHLFLRSRLASDTPLGRRGEVRQGNQRRENEMTDCGAGLGLMVLAFSVVFFPSGAIFGELIYEKSINQELIKRGYKRYNAATGKLEWTEKETG
jgi:hypothetical protein